MKGSHCGLETSPLGVKWTPNISFGYGFRNKVLQSLNETFVIVIVDK